MKDVDGVPARRALCVRRPAHSFAKNANEWGTRSFSPKGITSVRHAIICIRLNVLRRG